MKVLVSNLAQSEEAFRSFDPQIVFSLLDPGLIAPSLRSHTLVAHHVYRLWDVEDDLGARLRFVVGSLCDTALLARRELGPDCRMLIHCNAGASRSTAAAYVVIAAMLEPGTERAAFTELLRLTNKPWPNAAIVAEADRILGRAGRLSAALQHYRQTFPRRPGAYMRFNRRRGIAPVHIDADPSPGA